MPTDAEMTENDIREVLRRELHKEARAFEQLKGGRNSKVFRVDCADGARVAVKAYFRSANDRRDRMGCEFRAFELLHRHAIAKVPAPLASDGQRHIAIYEFIEGTPVSSREVAATDLEQVIDFLRTLREIASSGVATAFQPASEACFSIQALFDNLTGRFQALERAAANEPALAEFLEQSFVPFRLEVEESCRDFCRRHGIDLASEIPRSARTLSPSDFGFHNTLRRANGELVFLDFEYFGWDDPAKTVSDFLLHPGMELRAELKQQFFAGALPVFGTTPQLEERVRAVYPLYALKWCTILLNEFTLDHGARRSFAVGASGVWSQTTQLEKARRLLRQAIDDYRNFPYHC